MIDCCELALYNSQLVFKVVLVSFAVISFLLAMFFGYNLKWRKQQVELSKRTEQLERKNGKEFKELEKLKAQEVVGNPNQSLKKKELALASNV